MASSILVFTYPVGGLWSRLFFQNALRLSFPAPQILCQNDRLR
jgi:hypothetical protein